MSQNTQSVMEERDDYKFLKIRDALLALHQKVSFIGVVIQCSIPKQTRGTDSFIRLRICDDSHPKLGLPVNIFAENMELLPCIASLGDIIQLSYVKMKLYEREVFAQFDKKVSSFALYKGKDGLDFLPYQSSSRFCWRNEDRKLIADMRKWLCDFQLDEDSNDIVCLRDIKLGSYVNLACKILNITEAVRDACLLVWDGTDTPPNSTKPDDNQSPFPLECSLVSIKLMRSFPAAGSTLRVTLDQRVAKHIKQFLETGKWVKLMNVLCLVDDGLWHAMFSHSTKFRYVSNEDHLILQRQRSYERRLLEYGWMPYFSLPWSSCVTEVDHGDSIPSLSLRKVLTNSKLTAMFKCTVRVVNVFPLQAEYFRSPVGVYRIRLTLEDPTARLYAYLYAEDGEKFFNGYPPVDMLKRKMDKLLGVVVSDGGEEIKGAPRNPPWVQCCLKSYCLDEQKKRETRRYRIFDTKLCD